MQSFVSVIFENDNFDADLLEASVQNSLGENLFESYEENGFYLGEDNTIVYRTAISKDLTDEESDAFADALAEKLFAEGYDNFTIETSLNEYDEGTWGLSRRNLLKKGNDITVEDVKNFIRDIDTEDHTVKQLQQLSVELSKMVAMLNGKEPTPFGDTIDNREAAGELKKFRDSVNDQMRQAIIDKGPIKPGEPIEPEEPEEPEESEEPESEEEKEAKTLQQQKDYVADLITQQRFKDALKVIEYHNLDYDPALIAELEGLAETDTKSISEGMMPPQPNDPDKAKKVRDKFLELWKKGNHASAKKVYIEYMSIMGQGINKKFMSGIDKLIALDSELAKASKLEAWDVVKDVYLTMHKIRGEEPDPDFIARIDVMIDKLPKINEADIDDPENAKAALAILQSIDTTSSQWRKTKRGSIQTEELKSLQEILTLMGYNPGKADGWFGKKTARAVMAFQKDHDLTVDGDPGKQTIGKMIEIAEQKFLGTTPQTGTPNDPKEVNRLLLGQLKSYIFIYSPEAYAKLKDTHEVVYVRFRKETLYLAPKMPLDPNTPQNPEGPVVSGAGMPLDLPKPKDQGVRDIEKTAKDALKDESLEETYDGDDFFEEYGELWYNEDEVVDEADYQGRKVKLGKPMRGDVKKFKVYVKNPKGNVVKVNFGDPNMSIKKSNPARRRSFRARHNCDNPGPRHKARYWSCRKW